MGGKMASLFCQESRHDVFYSPIQYSSAHLRPPSLLSLNLN